MEQSASVGPVPQEVLQPVFTKREKEQGEVYRRASSHIFVWRGAEPYRRRGTSAAWIVSDRVVRKETSRAGHSGRAHAGEAVPGGCRHRTGLILRHEELKRDTELHGPKHPSRRGSISPPGARQQEAAVELHREAPFR